MTLQTFSYAEFCSRAELPFEEFAELSGYIVEGYAKKDKLIDREGTDSHIKQLIQQTGFNCIKYSYNAMAFGAAFDHLRCDFIAVNPYVNLQNIFEPCVREYKPCTYLSLKDIQNEETDDLQGTAGNINEEDMFLWARLSNGWTTTTCMKYLPYGQNANFHYYRPCTSMPIDDRAFYDPIQDDKPMIILHPTEARPMTHIELQACCSDCFNEFVEEELNKCSLLENPNFFWETQHDISYSHRPKEWNCEYTREVYNKGKFSWLDCVKKGISAEERIPRELLEIYRLPSWDEGRYVDAAKRMLANKQGK